MKVDVPVREFIAALMEYGKPCDVTTGAIGHALAAVIPAIQNAALERAAVVADDAAARIRGGKKRINMVDEHTASVLDEKAAAIRALKEGT